MKLWMGANGIFSLDSWPLWVFFGGIFLVIYLYVALRRTKKNFEAYMALAIDFFNEDQRYLNIKDQEGKYYMVNKAFLALHQKEEKDFIGKTDEEIFGEPFAKILREMDEEVLATQKVLEKHVSWEGKDYCIRKFPLMLPDGRPGIGVSSENITEDLATKEQRERIIRRNDILIDVFTKDFKSSHEQLNYVLYQALALTDSDYGYIYHYQEEQKRFSVENFAIKGKVSSPKKLQKSSYKLDHMGLWSTSVFSKQPEIHNGVPRGDQKLEIKETFNLMTVPVILGGKVVAVAGVANNPKGYVQGDAEELSLLMTGAWNAKERREYIQRMRETNIDLQENEEKLKLILNSSAEGIYGMDQDGRFTFINKSALRLLGYEDKKALIGKNCHEMIHHHKENGEVYPEHQCLIYKAIAKGETVTSEEEVFFKKDGSSFHTRYSAHPQVRGGVNIGAVVTFSDITARKIHEDNVRYLTFHDPLTGLYNRAYLESIYHSLDQEENYPLSVVVGDVNGLKLSNDIFGHSRGDLFLRRIAEVIQASTREEDLVFRVGGDEFFIFLKNTPLADAQVVMHRIHAAIDQEDFQGVKGSISLGLALRDKESAGLEDVLNEAEQNMYREKTLTQKFEGVKQLKYLVGKLLRIPEEKAHAENTRDLAVSLGCILGLPLNQRKVLEEAAYLHDIGKIPTILSKNLGGKEVYPTRKDHTVIGYRILNSFEETMDTAKPVLSHHEHFDGSGYPKGLKGEEIPIESRIIAVAEKFERLIGGAYKEPLHPEDAFSELLAQNGTLLDPMVLNALRKLLDSWGTTS